MTFRRGLLDPFVARYRIVWHRLAQKGDGPIGIEIGALGIHDTCMTGCAGINGAFVERMNSLWYRFGKCRAEAGSMGGEPWRGLIGSHDTRVVKSGSRFGQRTALTLVDFTQHDRPSRRLHSAGTGCSERPAAKVRCQSASEPIEVGDEEIVSHLIPFERRQVIRDKFITLGLGCDVPLLGWHRMLLMSGRQGACQQKAPSVAGG